MHWIQGGFNAGDGSGGALAEAELKAAPGAGMSHYITDIHLTNGGTGRTWLIRDGSTTLLSFVCAVNETKPAVSFRVPFKVGANKALTVTNGGASAGSVIRIHGFTDRG
jgi:hypothetical protein